ncbi:MAG: transposase [Spirochaetaceae bacterium]|jgi:hypothetical protein|nr:transposase [Spirochaetaceae bacterium]
MREKRLLLDKVWYHVETAVNNDEPLFWVARERARFRQVLDEAHTLYAFVLCGLSFCGPWVSFYIKPADGFELPEIMQWMKQTFAVRYNVMKHLDGHLWGDRYWSKILDGEPPEEIAAGEAECGDCAGSAASEIAVGEIPKARLERGPPDGDSHGAGEAAQNSGSPPLSSRCPAPLTGE